MRQNLVVVADGSGLPCAEVPCQWTWDLVEYLSFQRAAVWYRYHASSFTVTFQRMDVRSAQRMLDDWTHAGSPAAHAG